MDIKYIFVYWIIFIMNILIIKLFTNISLLFQTTPLDSESCENQN